MSNANLSIQFVEKIFVEKRVVEKKVVKKKFVEFDTFY